MTDDKKSFDPPKFEVKEVIDDVEIIENIEIPTKLVVTYVFNDTRIEHHIPKETYFSGDHILNLFYPITKLQEKTMNNFSVLIRLESGQATIEKDNAIAAISGQSLGSTEAWDGKINVDDTWRRLPLPQMFLLRTLKDKFNLEMQTPTPIIFNEQVKRFNCQNVLFKN